MRAAIDRAIPAWFLADPHTVSDLGGDGAADRAMGADALADRDLRACRRRRPGFRLADAAERQGAQRCKTTRGYARAAQERAALDPLIRLSVEGGELALPRSSFVSLDQHGRSPLARIPVDPVIGLDLVAFAITSLAFVVLALAIGAGLRHER